MNLSAVERKFLLRLWERPDHRAPIAEIKPNPKTSDAERDRICRKLARLGLVDYSYVVTKFAIAPAGRTLLKLDKPRAVLPLTPSELEVLRACAWGTITPGTLRKVPECDRQRVIQSLAQRKLIKIIELKLDSAWLTRQGKSSL